MSLLEVNGLTLSKRGAYYVVEEATNSETRPLPLYTGNGATPSSDQIITRLHRISNVSAEDIATLLGRFKSAAGSVTAYAPTNTLIITDTGTQIRRMLRLIEAIDVPRTGEQIWIEPIHYADAAEIAARLQEIFPSTGGGGSSRASKRPAAPRRPAKRAGAATPAAAGSTTIGSRTGESRITSIIPDERTNSLIILATERAYLRILEMIRQLDVPLEGEGRIHVHYVQNGDASEIAGTLTSLIGGGGGGAARRPSKAGGAARAGATGAAGGAGALFEGDVRVTTHEPTNALVITSSLHDYAALRRVIERLDKPRRQVFIDAVIMELSVDRSRQLGFNFHGGVPDPAGDGSLSIFGFGALDSVLFPGSLAGDQAGLEGLAVGVRGADIPQTVPGLGASVPGFGVVLTALATSSDTNVLATPHIIAMDNVQAEINVGSNIPLQTSGFPSGGLGGLAGLAGLAGGQQGAGAGALAGLAGGLGGGFGGAGGIQRQDVGTIIRVTPHINEVDEVRLEIEEEVSEPRGDPQGTLGAVSINRSTAKTEVMVRDQQTVVIGGLRRSTTIDRETKIPVLGDIPLIGALFRRTSRVQEQRNLLLFLTPYIIRDMSDLRSIYERKMRERQEFIDRYFVFGDHDFEPVIDYGRTRGLVAEIIAELDDMDEEARIAAEAAAEPPPEHVPRPPIGAFEVDHAAGDAVIGPEGPESPEEIPPTPLTAGDIPPPDTPPSESPSESVE